MSDYLKPYLIFQETYNWHYNPSNVFTRVRLGLNTSRDRKISMHNLNVGKNIFTPCPRKLPNTQPLKKVAHPLIGLKSEWGKQETERGRGRNHVRVIMIVIGPSVRYIKIQLLLIVRLRGHKQKKWINMVINFLLFVSSKPRCHAEFYYIESQVESGLLKCTRLTAGTVITFT